MIIWHFFCKNDGQKIFCFWVKQHRVMVNLIKDRAVYLKYNSWEKCLNSGEFERHFLWSFKVFQHFKKVLCQEQKLLKILLICHNWSTYQVDTHLSFLWGQQNKVLVFCPFYCYYYLCTSMEFEQNFFQSICYCF